MERFEELIDHESFIKNIKRMYIMKVIELHDIEKVHIVYNSDTKSFEINLIKDSTPYFFKYKVKRRRVRSTSPKISKKSKNKSVESIKENSNQNNKKVNKENKSSSGNSDEKLNLINEYNKDDKISNINNVESAESENHTDINTINNSIHNEESTYNSLTIVTNDSDDNLNNNNKKTDSNVKKNIIDKIHELLELMKYSNDLLIEVYTIINGNNPKIAIKKLNKYINNFQQVIKVPSRASIINDELIVIIDKINT